MSRDLERTFWRIFRRTLELEAATPDPGEAEASEPTRLAKDDLEAWDSLRHVELVFALEESFDLDISPDDVVELFSDTDTVLDYLRRNVD